MFQKKRHILASLILGGILLGIPKVPVFAETTDALKLLKDEGLKLGMIRFSLQGRANPVYYDLQLKNREQGHDEKGNFQSFRYLLAGPAIIKSELILKHYPGLTEASLDYEGPQLAQEDAIKVLMGLPKYARGMALPHLDRYWTGPSFSSEYGLLPDSNVLILWQQQKAQNYHLLIPMAGDGMMGEVGKHHLQFGVSMSSDAPNTPRHIPLFVFATDENPYRLTDRAYTAAFKAGNFYGRMRKEKPYPEAFRKLGWCSWNAYYTKVSEKNLLASAQSILSKKIPIGFVLIDDGWLNVQKKKLAGFEADAGKFPQGLGGAIAKLKELGIQHVGVWHTLHGYWDGVVSEDFKASTLFSGQDGLFLQDPRQRGETLYHDWYQHLSKSGIDFVKVDGQANTSNFTNGLLPTFQAGEGLQTSLQDAASKYFPSPSGPAMINCMEMTIDNAYNWRYSNIARVSEDYNPMDPATSKEHVYQCAYNAYWISNFAYPDYDMFQSYRRDADYHAIARAISGGPIYTADELGREKSEIQQRLCFSDGRLLMPDEPGQVTRDTLLVDTGMVPVPLKIFSTVKRPGFQAGFLAAFNVNKSSKQVTGVVHPKDIEGLQAQNVALYDRSKGKVHLLDKGKTLPIQLGEYGADLYTLVPVQKNLATFGLLDKYLGAAAIVKQHIQNHQANITLAEGGEFGAWLKDKPLFIKVNGQRIPKSAYSYRNGLLRFSTVPYSKAGVCQVDLQLK